MCALINALIKRRKRARERERLRRPVYGRGEVKLLKILSLKRLLRKANFKSEDVVAGKKKERNNGRNPKP